jgi:hypothetical protein
MFAKSLLIHHPAWCLFKDKMLVFLKLNSLFLRWHNIVNREIGHCLVFEYWQLVKLLFSYNIMTTLMLIKTKIYWAKKMYHVQIESSIWCWTLLLYFFIFCFLLFLCKQHKFHANNINIKEFSNKLVLYTFIL